jgi:hypothetical protein
MCASPAASKTRGGLGLEATALTATLAYHCDWCYLAALQWLEADGRTFLADIFSGHFQQPARFALAQACPHTKVDLHSDPVG